MKTYSIEPTCKKSTCEVELWRRPADILPTDDSTFRYNWNGPILRRECWWRWGEWTIEIPETEDEIQEFLEQKGFATVTEYLEQHGAETVEEVLLPDEEDDEHVLPPEVECNYCWDGQGEEFNIEQTRNSNLTDDECAELSSEAMRMYADEGMFEQGLEELGWEHYSSIYEIYCTLNVTRQKTEEEKLMEFKDELAANFNLSPETLGGLFEETNCEDTRVENAILTFGSVSVFAVIDDCIPSNEPILCKGIFLQPYLVAASHKKTSVDVIYHLLRRDISSLLEITTKSPSDS
mmetsp:Transcript_5115/g.5894  ORF Transcript_5115/g.5894 Transcript_5115/m.5894 type:complete len:292 (+) Transcript_5115:75-950(+)